MDNKTILESIMTIKVYEGALEEIASGSLNADSKLNLQEIAKKALTWARKITNAAWYMLAGVFYSFRNIIRRFSVKNMSIFFHFFSSNRFQPGKPFK